MSRYNALRAAEKYVEKEREITEDSDWELYSALVEDDELQEIALARYHTDFGSAHGEIDLHIDRAWTELTEALNIRAEEIEEEHRAATDEEDEQQ